MATAVILALTAITTITNVDKLVVSVLLNSLELGAIDGKGSF